MDTVGPGTIVTMPAFNRHYYGDDGMEVARFAYKAAKGEAFVFVLLGSVEKGGTFDPDGALKALGWRPPEDLK